MPSISPVHGVSGISRLSRNISRDLHSGGQEPSRGFSPACRGGRRPAELARGRRGRALGGHPPPSHGAFRRTTPLGRSGCSERREAATVWLFATPSPKVAGWPPPARPAAPLTRSRSSVRPSGHRHSQPRRSCCVLVTTRPPPPGTRAPSFPSLPASTGPHGASVLRGPPCRVQRAHRRPAGVPPGTGRKEAPHPLVTGLIPEIPLWAGQGESGRGGEEWRGATEPAHPVPGAHR